MSRIGRFLHLQRLAWWNLLALWPRRIRFAPPDPDTVIRHPSELCGCLGRPVSAAHDVMADHRSDCPWRAAWCHACHGTGWCERCGGDGTDPTHAEPTRAILEAPEEKGGGPRSA
jgi:hypothetical protein